MQQNLLIATQILTQEHVVELAHVQWAYEMLSNALRVCYFLKQNRKFFLC